MKRILTNSQRQALLKTFCLLLSVSMFFGAIFAVPYLAGAVPKLSGNTAQKLLYNSEALAQTVPVFALGSGNKPETEEDIAPDISRPEESVPEISEPLPTPNPDDLFVTSSNLCWYEIGENPSLNVIDRTSYNVDLADYLTREFPIGGTINTDPLVLIVHTHGSESYLPKNCDFYSPDEEFRSTDTSKNVVNIGKIICDKLNSFGVPTIHDETMHDFPDYNRSYNNSLSAIKRYLAEYPSIKFVIDVHRDSVFDSAGNNIKPVTTINKKDCAQLMLVIGTNERGIPHPNWRENLTFATYLQQEMNVLYPTLARPINLRTAEFNQAQTSASIILEVGSCGNTIEEAENSAILFAEAYASLIRKQLG